MSPHAEKMFETYFDLFRQRTRRWKIRLDTGYVADGTVSVSAMVNVENPMFSFTEASGKRYAVPFRRLLSAEKVL